MSRPRSLLEPLDVGGAREIAELYAGEAVESGVGDAAAGGEPRRAAPDPRGGGGVDASRSGAAGGCRRRARGGQPQRAARRCETELAGNVVDLQLVRERADLLARAATAARAGRVPVQGSGCRSGSTTPSTSAAGADGRRARRADGRRAARSASSAPSGSGKSSLLRAGLLPALAAGVLPGSEGWARVADAPRRASAERSDATRRPALARRRARRRRGRPVRGDRSPPAADEGERREFVDALIAPRENDERSRSWWRSGPTSTAAVRPTRAVRPNGREPRAGRADAARRAAAGDRTPGRSAQGCGSSPSWSTRCSATSRSSRAACRCSRPRCSSSGSGATAGGCGSPPTSGPAA